MRIKRILIATVILFILCGIDTKIQRIRRQGQDIERTISGTRQAEILKSQQSPNSTVKGSLHGSILGVAGNLLGQYQENRYILSIRFTSGIHTHLLDVPLRQAEVVHFQGKTTVKVFVECYSCERVLYAHNCYVLRFYLHPTGRAIGQEKISKQLLLSIYQSMKKQQ